MRTSSRVAPWHGLVLAVLLLGATSALHADLIANYRDAAGTGFYDPVYGASRRSSFEFAALQWELWLGGSDPVDIQISVGWSTLGAGVLGSSQSTQYIWRDFAGAGVANTWYGDALADNLYGSDLNPGGWDMYLTFNTDFTTWNYDYTLADDAFSGLYDFASVSMHEIGHGMGLWKSFASTGAWGYGTPTYPTIYDRFLEYYNGTDLIATNPAPDVTQNPGGGGAADDGIFWNGPSATAANGGNRVGIYAPATWAGGSSLSHPNLPGTLMYYNIGTNDERRTIDPKVSGMLQDIGWEGDSANVPEPTTLVLVIPGVAALIMRRRRQRSADAA